MDEFPNLMEHPNANANANTNPNSNAYDQDKEKDTTNLDRKDGKVCIICLNEIENGKMLNCGHVFHLHCIK